MGDAAGGLDYVKKKTKKVIRAAGLRDELCFTSFRHGGLTELGDADLTDTQIRALSRQKSTKVLPRYIKRTRRQIVAGTGSGGRFVRTTTADHSDRGKFFNGVKAGTKHELSE